MAASPASGCAYSCETAEQTREWMEAIAAFLRLHRPLLEAHAVNFFKDRLWEMVDAERMECLRGEPVESLLNLPSGCVQEHWSSSLREIVLTARSLVLPREQKSPQSLLPNLHVASIGTVLAQGMNSKKKHGVAMSFRQVMLIQLLELLIQPYLEFDMRTGDIYLGECHKFTLFKDFTISGLGRLGCGFVEDVSLLEIWKDVQPFTEFIGPFWCLRAALGPLVETYILLD